MCEYVLRTSEPVVQPVLVAFHAGSSVVCFRFLKISPNLVAAIVSSYQFQPTPAALGCSAGQAAGSRAEADIKYNVTQSCAAVARKFSAYP